MRCSTKFCKNEIDRDHRDAVIETASPAQTYVVKGEDTWLVRSVLAFRRQRC